MFKIVRIAALAMTAGVLAVGTAAGAQAAQHPVAVQRPVAAPAGAAGATHTVHPAAGGTYQGCKYGQVCLYPNNSWNGGHPIYAFSKYGYNPIHNQYGYRRVFNNQYGGAGAHLCKQQVRSTCTGNQSQYTYSDGNYITPINYVLLTTSG